MPCRKLVRDRMPSRSRPGRCSTARSEEHTSELQSPCNLVCRLLLEKKKTELRPPSCRITPTFGNILSHPRYIGLGATHASIRSTHHSLLSLCLLSSVISVTQLLQR